MSFVAQETPVPLIADTHGVIRVGHTRVTLDTVVGAFRDGGTAEELVQQYPSLQLAEVYSVIGYYLHHRAEVDAYLRECQHRAEEIRAENEAQFDPSGIRERLMARRHHGS